MASEKFCLRWNDFESNISTAFRELRDDKDFFDVTLACDDEQIQAHKVILSACSPFFWGVLRRNPHAHPLLYLKEETFFILNAEQITTKIHIGTECTSYWRINAKQSHPLIKLVTAV